MKRVVALWLPQWPIERLWRAEPNLAPPPTPPEPARPAGLDPLADKAAAERAVQCSVPRGGGWRPGARWARADMAARIAALPAHRRPAKHEFGRADEAAGNPFKVAPGDEVGTSRALHSVRPERSRGTGPSPPCLDFARHERFTESPLLVTTTRVGSRIEIAAASPAAQAAGAAPGMTLTSARASLPELVVRPADRQGDRVDLARLADLLARRWSPAVAFDGDAGLLIDASGVAHLHGGEAAMARLLVRLLARAGFTARLAIADTVGAAHALSRHGPALSLCPPGAQDAWLAPLPVEALRLEAHAIELLRRLGVDTIGALAAMPRAPLARRFGAALVAQLDKALGHVHEPIEPVTPHEGIAIVERFAEPIATAEAIAHWIGQLVPGFTAALAGRGLGARRLMLVAERVDHVPQSIRIGLARPSRDPAHLLKLLLRRIEDIAPGYGIDALTLRLVAADSLGPQELVQRLDEATTPDLAPLIDTLATNGTRTWRAAPRESDVPERSVAAIPPLDPSTSAETAAKTDDVAQLRRLGPLTPWSPLWPRPARLLARPEPIDNVMYGFPDQPPRRFTWRGVAHRVVQADGPERITGEWWRRAGEREAVRDYFRVEDEAGARFWLYRRGDGERASTGDLKWFLHGWFA